MMETESENMPRVSIITATYESENTIRRALLSVINQSYANIEHIIVDGLSSDNTINIVEEISPFSIVISDLDKGIYDAFNKGIKAATGDFICFLNSDDYYRDSEIINKAINQVRKSNADILLMGVAFVNNDSAKIEREYPSLKISKKNLQSGFMPPHPGMLIKREIFEDLGNFCTDLRICGDYEFVCRIAASSNIYKICVSKTIAVNMSHGGVSTKSFKNRLLLHHEIVDSLRRNNLKASNLCLLIRYVRKIKQFKWLFAIKNIF